MRLLDGVRVLDLSRMLAGPYGSMLLADLGAEVIKIEDPRGGDPMRIMGPPFLGPERDSAYFLSINRNKKSVALDLETAEGRDVFHDLCRVVGRGLGELPARRDGAARVRARRPSGAQSAARRLLDLGLRPGGPVPGVAGVRPRAPGDGRRDEPHRRGGPGARADGPADGRPGGRDVRRARGGERPLPARADGRGGGRSTSRSSTVRSRS